MELFTYQLLKITSTLKLYHFSTSNYNNIDLIKESYKDLKPTKNSIVNTDQGAVYFAYEYVELSKTLGFTRSMSHKGHCWENCPIENWFMQLKHEWLCQFNKLTRKEATDEIKKYIHWYNNERIQKEIRILVASTVLTQIFKLIN